MTAPLAPLFLRVLGLFLLLGTLVRAVLYAGFLPAALPVDSVSPLWPLAVFAQGFLADLIVALAAAGLASAGAALGSRGVRLLLLFLLSVVALLVPLAEVFFWNEFQSRLDRLVFHYLSYPREVFTFLEDQFYLSLFAVPFILLAALVTAWLNATAPDTTVRRSLVVGGLCGALCLLSLWPVNLPPGRIATQLASNGYLGVLTAALTDERRWQGKYPGATTRAVKEATAERLAPGSKQPSAAPLALPEGTPPRHLVLIVMESFAGALWLDPAQRERYLPAFTALAERSWSFSNVFASGSRTTRGMEAIFNGMMPLPGVSTSQRAHPERLPSLPRALTTAGWHSAFIYAGWADFSDFNRYWRAIGFQDTTSRADFAADGLFETSWGYADEHLFERLAAEMSQRTARHEHVFLGALTVSHHRPYDYPEGRVPWPADERRSAYAMAYADWALGEFFVQARREPWFEDTLFVIAADHGPTFHGNASIPINSYRVPLLLHAPGWLAPQPIDHLGSLMELPGTLLELLRVPHEEAFYGTSLRDGSQALVPVEHDYDVGLIDRSGVTVLRRAGLAERWNWEETNATPRRLLPGTVPQADAVQVHRLFRDAHARYYGERAQPLPSATAARRSGPHR
ncbi:MAG: LTA synthase family protein [Pseudomonadota bacterium]